MFIFLVTVTALTFIFLLLVAGVNPRRSQLSLFELRRRSGSGDKNAKEALHREELIADLLSLLTVKATILLAVFVILSILTFGWLIGVVSSILVAVFYGSIAKIKFISRISQKLYGAFEPESLKVINKSKQAIKIIRHNTPNSVETTNIASRQELEHVIDSSDGALTDDEKKLITSALSFNDVLVNSVMTPRDKIDSIKKTEFLGPLTLNDLHKTGHSRLPVVDGSIDSVVGILNLQSLLALDTKRSTTAAKTMDKAVYYIREDQTLHCALAGFLTTHSHLFVVVDESRETVGLLTLRDVVEALIGRKVVGALDAYGDLRTVALKSPGQSKK